MVNFMGQLDLFKACPDSWQNIIAERACEDASERD
jgi:hypothetical protein